MDTPDSCLIAVRVTPRASREQVQTVGDTIKVWVMASPTDGQANDAVTRLVAKRLGLAPTRVTVTRGQTSREKTLRVEGLDEAQARAKLT